MAKSERSDIRLLLIQARDEEHILFQEQCCFAERCEVALDQIRPVNVLTNGINGSLLEDADAVMIGGAGRYSAAVNYDWMPSLLEVVRMIYDRDLPLFGSCWGHQVIARALGGTVVHDLGRAELGCFGVELTDAGRRDAVFGLMPASFLANMGHHDRVSDLPDVAIELARNESQPNQAFRIRSRSIYGTQFHSELDATRERERLLEYRQEYQTAIPSDEEFDRVVTSLSETTEADKLLSYFISYCVLETGVRG